MDFVRGKKNEHIEERVKKKEKRTYGRREKLDIFISEKLHSTTNTTHPNTQVHH